MTRKLFGENKGRGIAGISKLSFGIDTRRRKADPVTVLSVVPPKVKRRKVQLRKEVVPE